jgi:hypothetical protein
MYKTFESSPFESDHEGIIRFCQPLCPDTGDNLSLILGFHPLLANIVQ